MGRSLPSTLPSSSRRTEDLVHEVSPEHRLRAPSWPTSPPPSTSKLRRTRVARHESPSERRGGSSSGAALAAALPCSSPRGYVPGNIAQPLRPITLPRAWPQAAQPTQPGGAARRITWAVDTCPRVLWAVWTPLSGLPRHPACATVRTSSRRCTRPPRCRTASSQNPSSQTPPTPSLPQEPHSVPKSARHPRQVSWAQQACQSSARDRLNDPFGHARTPLFLRSKGLPAIWGFLVVCPNPDINFLDLRV